MVLRLSGLQDGVGPVSVTGQDSLMPAEMVHNLGN